MRSYSLALALAIGGLGACSAADSSVLNDGGGGATSVTSASAGGHGGDSATSSSSGDGGAFSSAVSSAVSSASSGAGGEVVAEVYGNSPSQLYKLNPVTKEVTVVGPFNGCSSVVDIAIDKNHAIYGATYSGLYAIDKSTVKCTLIKSGSYPNSLSFVPVGSLDANEEVLVGYQGATYIRIHTTSGQITPLGTIGGGLASSGDIVSVKGGGTYLTVTGNGCSDCLIEVDPKTGSLVKNFGSVGYGQVYGLAYWGGSAYGFSNSGKLFEILFMGNSIATQLIPVPGAPAGLKFWGAGSSTIAPVKPPK
jgi:hypothetical protein